MSERNDLDGNPPVAVLGLGRMGSALARAFLARAHPTTVWNRSGEKAADLLAAGASGAATAAEAVTSSQLIVVCVHDGSAARAVLEPLAEGLEGRLVVNLTTTTPEESRALAAWAGERGVAYLGGAVMAVPPLVGKPEATVLYAGSAAQFERVEQTLASLGTGIHLGEDHGLASLYDFALLGIMWASYSGFLQGAALLGAEGVPASAFAPLAGRWLTGLSTALPRMAEQIDAGEYATDISTLELNAVGLELMVRISREHSLDPALPEALQAIFDRGVSEGHGPDAISSLVEVVRGGARR